MAKDPAFLFYHHDFLVGTAFMSLADRGAYITLLCYMADKGKLSSDDVKIIAGNNISTTLSDKFKKDEEGFWYNQRLLEEVEKRKAFCKSRSENRMSNICKTSVEHMVNVNRNEDKDVIKKGNKKQPIKKAFVPPTLEEVKSYCLERKNKIDPQYFIDKNTTIGWLDKNKIPYKDWKAVVRTWESWTKATTVPPKAAKRPVMIVVVEKIAAGCDNRAILHDLVGTYSEHEINEALMKAKQTVQ